MKQVVGKDETRRPAKARCRVFRFFTEARAIFVKCSRRSINNQEDVMKKLAKKKAVNSAGTIEAFWTCSCVCFCLESKSMVTSDVQKKTRIRER